MSEPVKFIQHMVSLDYQVRTSPVMAEFLGRMRDGRIVGHKCPSCGLVFVPPKGFCPICTVATGAADEVDVQDRGTVTSFTVLTPIQYRGQQEREPYALASLLLDGADSTVGTQRLGGVALDDVRTGMRVKAVWREPGKRVSAEDVGLRWGLGSAISHWEPTDEPDTPADEFKDHVL